MGKVSIFWFRRDLRMHDNAGLYHALKGKYPVVPIFIFDKNILDQLKEKDPRVEFIHDTIIRLKRNFQENSSNLLTYYGTPNNIWKRLLKEFDIGSVYANRDYDSYSKNRDEEVRQILEGEEVPFYTFKDHTIFEGLEVEKPSGGAYTVFTPYSKKWKSSLTSKMSTMKNEKGCEESISFYLKPYPTLEYVDHLHSFKTTDPPALNEMGFTKTNINIPPIQVKRGLIRKYDQTRDYPGLAGTSRLGIHFRFGTISIREKSHHAQELNATFLNELIWRDFYAMILDNFPHVEKRSFREKYDQIKWRNDENEFKQWCEGKTGYPLVDAGMRELNQTGYMHNRVRMVTASFLTKHLLIDWRWGEAFFAEKLLDFDLASNNGGWQWAAGCGTDAAPYFRIFNPISQQKKFDKNFEYVQKWVPEFGTDEYPEPIVDHKEARERCLKTYKEALNRE